MTTPEFSRPVDIREADGKRLTLTASERERAALATRLQIIRVDSLEARIELERSGSIVSAKGTLSAEIVQSCAVSAEDVPVTIHEALDFRFVPEVSHRPDEELELDADDLDEIDYAGTSFDVGEAVAQSLALAIDPFLTGPEADATRHRAGLLDENEAGPFAALKGLLKE